MKKIEKNISQFFLTSSILLYNLPPTSQQMKLPAKLAIASLAIVTAASIANAQNVTATTDPVGFVTATVPVGISPLAVTLLNPDLLKTTATSVSSNSVALSGQTNVGSLLSAGEPYYIEVYSGSLKGDRFDVDTAATISAANGFVTLNAPTDCSLGGFRTIGRPQ
jgi:hypothetical protein